MKLASEMPEFQTNLIRDLFKNFLFVLNFSGMQLVRTPTSMFITYLRRVFAFFILFCMSFYTVLLTKSCLTEKVWSSVKVSKISMSVWFAECTGVYVFLLYWQVKAKFIKHVQMLYLATSHAGAVKYKRQLSVVTSVLFAICIVSDVFLVGLYIDFQIRTNPKSDSVTEQVFVEQTYGKILLCFTYFYTLLAYMITSAIFIFFCTIDTVEFVHLSHQFKEEKDISASTLKTYFTKHTKLVSAVDQLNDTFCFYIFFQLCGVIPIIILYIYGYFTGLFELDLNGIPWLIVLSAMVLIFTLGPAAINYAVKNITLCHIVN